MSDLNEFEIDFDEMPTVKNQTNDCIKVNVVKLDHKTCAAEKNNNDSNIKNIIIDTSDIPNIQQESNNNNNLETIDFNCDNLKSIDSNTINTLPQTSNDVIKEINLDEL
mgnify:FL=1